MPLWKSKFRKSGRSQTVVALNEGGGGAAAVINGEVCSDVNEGVDPQSSEKATPILSLSNGTNVYSKNGVLTGHKQHPPKAVAAAPELLVIIKDFTGSNKKEMSVHRGQVVQRMYSCGTWLNVQNIDGHTGYIPTNVCCPKDEVADSTWYELNKEEPPAATPTVDNTYENIPNKLDKTNGTAATFPYNSMSSTTTASTSLSRQSSKSTYPDTPRSNSAPQRVPVRKLSGTPMGTLELSGDSPPVPRYSIEHILHPLHPLSITRSQMSSDSQSSSTVRRSSLDSINPSTPAVQPLLAHNRNDSYLEAVVEEKTEERGSSPRKGPVISIKRPSRPSDLPILPMYGNLAPQRLETILTSNGGTAQHMIESSQTSCLVDDVFLPSIQKPVGIYEVMKSYEKQTEGEVSVSLGEYVIALQMGYGEWALVMNSSNCEGLVPRGHLCRYSPLGRKQNQVSVGTQTELIIMAPVIHHQQSTASSSSSGTNRGDIVCIRDIRPSSATKKNCGRETTGQTNCNKLYTLDCAWEEEEEEEEDERRFFMSDDPWYENSMSIPQLPQNDALYTNDAPSICTLPTLNGVIHERGEAPLAFHSSRESLPQFPLRNFSRQPSSKRFGPSDTFSPASIRRTLREQSDWPLSPGVFSNFSEFSASPRSPQMVILKATKDFTPDIDGTDYLSLCKGDILHLIPGHNPYKGWLWVHHVGQRCYGYIPKTHVTNACSLDLKHKNGVTLYDEV